MVKILNLGNSKDSELLKKSGLGILFLTFALYKLTNTTADPDLWGYMAFGRSFWENGTFLYKDIFSYLPTYNRWIYHEWLTGVLFYPLYKAFGASGLQLLKYCMGLGTLGIVYITALRRGANSYSTILVLFAISGFLEFGYSPVRAQIFTFCFFSLTLYLLETARLTNRWKLLWFIVPIQIVWCNLHGGFIVGLGLIGLYIVGEAISRRSFLPYAGILIISVLATLINPYGIEYWHYLIRSIPMSRPEITEWASVYTAYTYGILNHYALLYFLALIIFLVLQLWWLKHWEPTAYLGLGLTFYLGLRHQRHLDFFLLLAGIYIPAWLTAFLQAMKSDTKVLGIFQRIGWKIPTIIGIFFIFYWSAKFIGESPLSLKLPSQPNPDYEFSVYYPLGAVNYIKEHSLSGDILTEFSWGEYLIWTLHPQCRVSLDGRYEQVYPEHISKEYFDFLFGRGNWKQFLNKYPPDMILIPSKFKIYSLILNEPTWTQVYQDSGAALFKQVEHKTTGK